MTVDLQTMMRLSVDLGDNAHPQVAGLREATAVMTQLEEDLGLKLDSRCGRGEVLVIDRADLPTPKQGPRPCIGRAIAIIASIRGA